MTRPRPRRARTWTRWALIDASGEVCGVGVHRMIPYREMGYSTIRVSITEILQPRTPRRKRKARR